MHHRLPLPMLPILIVAALAAGGSAAADPMDLHDLRPRWVQVRFEISPSDRPGQRQGAWSEPVPARFEPLPGGREVRVSIPAAAVERHLFVEPAAETGTFSDYVWRFDVATGEVLSAEVSGTVLQEIRFGPATIEARTRIRSQLSSVRRSGFRRARRLFGTDVFRYCEEPEDDCEIVPGSDYDPGTGYANAVGELEARSRFVTVRTFSPIGEAQFHEADPLWTRAEPSPPVSAGPVVPAGVAGFLGDRDPTAP